MHERRFQREIERLRDSGRIARLEVDRVVQLALEGLASVKTVLDVGTGSGLFAENFSGKGLAVTGVDANPEMLPAAQAFVPSAIFQEAVAEKLPFEDASFDLVFMGLVLHETDDPAAAIREARRVSRQRAAVLEWPGEVQEFGPPLEHRLPEARILNLAREAGFGQVESLRLQSLILYRFTQ